MAKKIIDDIKATYGIDPESKGARQYVGVIYFERPHPQLTGKRNQYILRTGIRHSEIDIKSWCRQNLDAVTPEEVNALLAATDLQHHSTEHVHSAPLLSAPKGPKQ